MTDKSRFSSPFKKRSREMRQSQTEAEKHAWFLLRDRRTFGLKFRRQVPIDDFIVDFYCDEVRLVIEIDGACIKSRPRRRGTADETRD